MILINICRSDEDEWTDVHVKGNLWFQDTGRLSSRSY